MPNLQLPLEIPRFRIERRASRSDGVHGSLSEANGTCLPNEGSANLMLEQGPNE